MDTRTREITLNKKTISEIHAVLKGASIEKLELSEKFSLIRIARDFDKIVTDLNESVQAAIEKLKPEGFDAILGKLRDNATLTKEETETHESYARQIGEFVAQENAVCVTAEIPELTHTFIENLLASNPKWSLGEASTVCNLIF